MKTWETLAVGSKVICHLEYIDSETVELTVLSQAKQPQAEQPKCNHPRRDVERTAFFGSHGEVTGFVDKIQCAKCGNNFPDEHCVSQWEEPKPEPCKHISQGWVETSFVDGKGRKQQITRRLICMTCGVEIG